MGIEGFQWRRETSLGMSPVSMGIQSARMGKGGMRDAWLANVNVSEYVRIQEYVCMYVMYVCM